MRKVITYGTFDLIHRGHINILRRARELGDYLIVALSTDEFNSGKGKRAYYTYEERKQILESIRFVDEVIPETCWEQKLEDVIKHGVAVFVIGDDWTGKFDFLKPHCEVVYMPRTEGISTTKIREDLKDVEHISPWVRLASVLRIPVRQSASRFGPGASGQAAVTGPEPVFSGSRAAEGAAAVGPADRGEAGAAKPSIEPGIKASAKTASRRSIFPLRPGPRN